MKNEHEKCKTQRKTKKACKPNNNNNMDYRTPVAEYVFFDGARNFRPSVVLARPRSKPSNRSPAMLGGLGSFDSAT